MHAVEAGGGGVATKRRILDQDFGAGWLIMTDEGCGEGVLELACFFPPPASFGTVPFGFADCVL